MQSLAEAPIDILMHIASFQNPISIHLFMLTCKSSHIRSFYNSPRLWTMMEQRYGVIPKANANLASRRQEVLFTALTPANVKTGRCEARCLMSIEEPNTHQTSHHISVSAFGDEAVVSVIQISTNSSYSSIGIVKQVMLNLKGNWIGPAQPHRDITILVPTSSSMISPILTHLGSCLALVATDRMHASPVWDRFSILSYQDGTARFVAHSGDLPVPQGDAPIDVYRNMDSKCNYLMLVDSSVSLAYLYNTKKKAIVQQFTIPADANSFGGEVFCGNVFVHPAGDGIWIFTFNKCDSAEFDDSRAPRIAVVPFGSGNPTWAAVLDHKNVATLTAKMDQIDTSEETILRVIDVTKATIIRTKKLDHIKHIGGFNHPFMAMDNMHIYIVSASTLYVHMRSTLTLVGSFNFGIDQRPRCHLISPGELMCTARNEVYALRFNKPVSRQVLTGVLADPSMGHEVEHQFDQSNWVKMAASILQIPLIGVATTTLLLAKHPDIRIVLAHPQWHFADTKFHRAFRSPRMTVQLGKPILPVMYPTAHPSDTDLPYPLVEFDHQFESLKRIATTKMTLARRQTGPRRGVPPAQPPGFVHGPVFAMKLLQQDDGSFIFSSLVKEEFTSMLTTAS